MKNSADLGECYPPRPSASVDNTLLDLQNSSYPTQPHSIIAKYMTDELVDYSVTMAMLLGSLNTSASKMKVMAKLNQFYSRKYRDFCSSNSNTSETSLGTV